MLSSPHGMHADLQQVVDEAARRRPGANDRGSRPAAARPPPAPRRGAAARAAAGCAAGSGSARAKGSSWAMKSSRMASTTRSSGSCCERLARAASKTSLALRQCSGYSVKSSSNWSMTNAAARADRRPPASGADGRPRNAASVGVASPGAAPASRARLPSSVDRGTGCRRRRARPTAPQPHRRQHLEAVVVLEQRDEPGVQQRRLARARRRVEQHDAVRDDERDERPGLLLAPEEQRRARCALERPRADVRVRRLSSHGIERLPAFAQLAHEVGRVAPVDAHLHRAEVLVEVLARAGRSRGELDGDAQPPQALLAGHHRARGG